MANVLNDTESIVPLCIGAIILWALYQFRDFFGLGAATASDAAGKAQAVKNVLNGMPDGADPGTIPLLQDVQGLVESSNNFSNYVFGTQEELAMQNAVEVPAAIVPPTPDQISQVQQFVDNYATYMPTVDLSSDPVSWLQQNKIF